MNINYADSCNFKPIPAITPLDGYWQNSTWKFNMSEISAGAASQPSWIDIILKGNTALTLVNAKEDSLSYLKLFGDTEQLPEQYLDTVVLSGGCEQRNLPEGYTQLEYIKKTSLAYIDSGINQTNSVGISIDVKFDNYNTGTAFQYALGAYNNGDYIGVWKANNSNVTLCFATAIASVSSSDNTSFHNFKINYLNSRDFSYDDSKVGDISQTKTATSPSIYIGDTNYSQHFGNSSFSIKRVRISNETTIVFDGIPAKTTINGTEVVGLYDTVSGTFKTAIEGTFTAGPEVVPTPDYPMDIVCNNGVIVGGNRYNANTIETGCALNDIGAINISLDTQNGIVSDWIEISPNTQYELSFTRTQIGIFTRVCDYSQDNENSFISLLVKDIGTSAGDRTYTFTTSSTAKYLRFCTKNDSTNIMFIRTNGVDVVGTTETITDNVGNAATAQNLLAIGNYKDTQEMLSGSVTRNVGVIVLTGEETMALRQTRDNIATYHWSSVNGCPTYYGAIDVAHLCSHLLYKGTVTSGNATAGQPVGLYAYWSENSPTTRAWYFNVDATVFPTLQDWIDYLTDQYNAGSPVTIVYPLATATTESTTPQLLTKSPVTQTAGSISNLPIAITESSHTTPTPQQPLPINCNNGVVKVSQNINNSNASYNINEDLDWYISGLDKTKTYTLCLKGDSDYVYISTAWLVIGMDGTSTVISTQITSDQINTTTIFAKVITGCDKIWFRRIGTQYATGSIKNIALYYGNLTANIPTYRPYGQIYVDGTTETVEVTGKNLFNLTGQTLDKYIDASNNEQDGIYSNLKYAHTGYLKVEPNTTYTFAISCSLSNSQGSNLRIYDYTSNKTFIGNIATLYIPVNTAVGTRLSETFTTGATTEYLRINYIYYPDGEQPQLELGSTATTYEPYYNGGQATAEDLLKVGTYQDVQSVLDGGVTRNVGIKVLDGTETITKQTSASAPLGYYFGVESSNINHIANTQMAKSSHFVAVPNNAGALIDGSMAFASSTKKIWIATSLATTEVEFKRWLSDQYNSGFPVIIVYPLATATTETVTAQPLTIQAGGNVVSITQASMDNLELEVSYKAGVAVTITEIENAQLDNSVEVTING